MEFVASIFGSIISIAAECTISPIKNHIKLLCCDHDSTVQSLKDQVDRLKAAGERVQHSVDAAARNGEEIERDVLNWLATVNHKIDVQVERVLQGEENAKKKCCAGFCPNIWARYKHGIKAEAEAKAVAELLLQQASFVSVSYRSAPRPITAVSVRGFEAFRSRTVVFDEIMEALKEASVSIIGVHGMGGVGKTTLVKEIARQVKEAKLFDYVIIVTVTQSLDIEKIQGRIADAVGLKFEEESVDGRADRLRERLKNGEKILVVLDDIWERLDLEQVGIPCGDEHEGCCKILLTSRDLNVLSNGMDTQINFGVGILTEEEAWDFFRKMAGDCVDQNDLKPIANDVANKCAGLPVAIATVARALKNKSLIHWKDALCELKSPASRDHQEVTKTVHSAIKLSYSYLKSEEYKITFLLCCLLGHNSLIEDLLRYALGWGLFGGFNTIEEARNRVFVVVDNLKASCLLLDSYDSEYFDIHDVVWDVAISIASRDYHMFVLREGELLKQWPKKETMNNCSAINLHRPRVMTVLPDEMEGSQLSFFCMENDGPSIIPANFFRGSERLKVLDLARLYFSSLPVSINVLTNLHTLCLKGCAPEDISIVGKLKMLEILSLAHSYNMKALPKEIEQLTQLRLLDLSWCNQLQIIRPNVLASLSKLEELYMDHSFDRWEDEANASLEELKHLSHLTTLYVRIPNVEIIPKDLFIKSLDRYKILIGVEEYYWDDEYECSRTLKISRMHTSIYMDDGVKILLNNVEDLYLDQLKGVKHVLFELNDGKGFPHLKKLHIRNSMDLQYIAAEKIEIASKQFVFPHLESLSIVGCGKLEHLFSPNECLQFVFPHLESLSIHGCGKLEHLFSPSTARSMMQLKSLEISQCNCLRDVIFADKEEKNDVICFPQLSSLVFLDLKELKCFYPGQHTVALPMLKELEIDVNRNDPPQSTTGQAFFLVEQAMPHLEKLRLRNSGDDVAIIICNGIGLFPADLFFHPVKVLELRGSFQINSLLKRFCNLETLKISHVDFSQELDDAVEESGAIGTLSGIRKLKLTSLKKVKHMGKKFYWELPNLETFEVRGCDDLINFGPSSFSSSSFKSLTTLTVEHCDMMRNLLTASIVQNMVQLTTLKISYCRAMTEVVANDLEDSTTTSVAANGVIICFNKLKFLQLKHLKSLASFCPAGNYIVEFPSLEDLIVEECPALKIFYNGVLSTPRLQGVKESTYNRRRGVWTDDLNTTIRQLYYQKVSFSGIAQTPNVYSQDDLPKTVVRTLNQGSNVMSMDFHPQLPTILLVGTNVGDISLWEVRSRERLAHKPFKVWDISTASVLLQTALLNDAVISVNRCVWARDGHMLGVAFSKHIVQVYHYTPTGELKQHLEIDAHVGGVNDIAFDHPHKPIYIVTCGDDKMIKVWDSVSGRRHYTFEGHEAPVYSVCPHYIENIQFIFSTAIDGKIKAWLYNCLGSRMDYDAPGLCCTTMAYSADGTRLFSCGTSKDGESYLVEWNESEGAIKRTYSGFGERSLGVVQFDTTRNRFLAAGSEFRIKFWDMDNTTMLTAVDADGGLPASPRLRFNKEGSLLAVTTSDNGIKILANSYGCEAVVC